MSTAIAEPPIAVEPTITTPPPVAPTPEARKANADSFLRPPVRSDSGIVTQAPDLTQKKPTPEIAKTPEGAVTLPPTDPKEVSIAELRKGRDEARKQLEEFQKTLETEKAERARIAAEMEEYKKRPDPKEYIEKLSVVEKEREEYRQQLRAAALERDPGFKKEYDDRINLNAKSMLDLMTGAGVEPAEALRAVNKWDEDSFAVAAESMTPAQKMKFQASWMQAEQIHNEKRSAIANADAEWAKRTQQAELAQKSQQEQHQAFLESEKQAMFRDLFSKEGLADKKELQDAARQAVEASFGYSPRQLMEQVAYARVLAEGVKQKDADLTATRAELDTLKKKVAEQEEFIKAQNGGVARISPSDPGEAPVDKKARAASFLNPTIRG